MFVPLEIVREIIAAALYSPAAVGDEPGVSKKQNWLSIQPLTLASRTYRTLALEAWFQTFYIRAYIDIDTLRDMFPNIAALIRELHCVQFDNTSLWDLNGLSLLSRIRLDWLSPIMSHSDSEEDQLPFVNVPSSLRELDIRGLPWPSPVILHNIRILMPDLNVLRLRQHTIWCGLCNTCSFTGFRPPWPDKLVYEGGGGLPTHYARALYPLKDLHTVSFTVANFGHDNSKLTIDAKNNPYLWTGECYRCMEELYEDVYFRNRWVADKKEIIPPPALKRVEWHFFKADGVEEEYLVDSGDEWSETGEEEDDLMEEAFGSEFFGSDEDE